MTPERWRQVAAAFQSALARDDNGRVAFLDTVCKDDMALRREVQALIGAHNAAGSFIDVPAYEAGAHLLIDEAIPDLAGESVAHYRVIELLGTGAMGEVYLAEDTSLARKVALKFLPEALAQDEAQLDRFTREACAASALNHPNVLTVHEIGTGPFGHFIATEFIDGVTLRDRIAARIPTAPAVLEIAVQVASALSAAHDAGIIHRDVKPENIMVRRDGLVKVLDFGLAKVADRSGSHATATGLVMGTPAYMSPEQARGLPVDARSDIWSLGMVVDEMAGGLRERSATIDAIVARATRTNPAERYQTMAEMLAALRASIAEPDSRARRSRTIVTAMTATVGLATAVAAIVAFLDDAPNELLHIQQATSARLVAAIRPRSTAVQGDIPPPPTTHPEAYQDYLRGRFLWNRRSAEGLRTAIGYFNRAIAADSGYAIAYAALADCYLAMSGNLMVAPADTLPQAKAAARRALELDATRGEVHATWGGIAQRERDWAKAEAAYQRAIALAPNHPTAHESYAEFLQLFGREDEAIAMLRYAITLDPVSPVLARELGEALYRAGRFDEARRQLDDAIALAPDFVPAHVLIGWIQLQQRQHQDALATFRKLRTLPGGAPSAVAFEAHTHALSGRRARARPALAELDALARDQYVAPLFFAVVHLAREDRERAFAVLRQTCEAGDDSASVIKDVPRLEYLRADPRWSDLFRCLKMPS